MDIQKSWEKALSNTEIIRSRVQALLTFAATKVPYVLLSESRFDPSNTVVRKGEVVVERPAIVLPPNSPQFEGFDFTEEDRLSNDIFANFLYVRGINVPSLKYNNKTDSLDLHDGKLKNVIEYYNNLLQRKEDVHTGLVIGPDDCWQFSVLIFICSQIVKNADTDIKRLLEEYRKGKPPDGQL